MRRWYSVLAGLMVLGLIGSGCDGSGPASVEPDGAHRVAIDLRPLHQRTLGGVPEGCLSVIDRVILSVDGTEAGRREVAPGEDEVGFEVTVPTGQVTFSAEVLSTVDTVLYAASRQVQIDEAGFSIPLPLQKRSPVLQVCPDTLRLAPGTESMLAVSNVGIGTLQWEIDVPAAQCDGQPCLRVEPASGTLGPGTTASLRVTPNTAASQRVGVSVRTQVGDTPAQVETATNQPPAFASDPVTQGQVNVRYAYEARATDPEGEAVTLTAPTLPAWLAFTDNGDGTGLLAGTPDPDDEGENDVVLEVSDGLSTVQQAFTIGVGENPPPAFTSDPVTEAVVGQEYRYVPTAADPEGEAVTLTAPTLPAWLAFTDNGDGTGLLAGTPGPNDVGAHAVRLEASDGNRTTASDFVITVAPPAPPEAADDAVVTNEEVPVEIDVLANDAALDPEALSIVDWTPPRAGEVILTDTKRSFQYFPAPDASGPDAFTYTVSDAFEQTDQATVQVFVNPCIDFEALTEADLDVGPGPFFTENEIPVFIREFDAGGDLIFDTMQLNDEAGFEGTFGQGQMLTLEGVNLVFELRATPARYLRLEYLDRNYGDGVVNFSVNGAAFYVATSLTDKAPTPDGITLEVTRAQSLFGVQGTLTLRAEPPAALTSLLIGGSYLALDNVCIGQDPR